MARILGTSTLTPNGSAEQTINLGFQPTWLTITVVNGVTDMCRSEGKATSSYQHCQAVMADATDAKAQNETGYIVRIYDRVGGSWQVIGSAKLKSFNATGFTLKEITIPASPTLQMLIEAGT